MHKVQELLLQGKHWSEIMAVAKCSRRTVGWHAAKLRGHGLLKYAKRYDWSAVKEFAAEHTAKECMEHFGFSCSTWASAVQRGDVKRKRGGGKKKLWQEILRNTGKPQHHTMLKRALIESGRPYKCEDCGLGPLWNGKPLLIQVDHADGNALDHSPSNVKFRCPNCHSQTPTYGNKGNRRGTRIYRRQYYAKTVQHQAPVAQSDSAAPS